MEGELIELVEMWVSLEMIKMLGCQFKVGNVLATCFEQDKSCPPMIYIDAIARFAVTFIT